MMSQTINISGLTPEQIEQIKVIVEAFQAKNQLALLQTSTEQESTTIEKKEVNFKDLFFESEILADFNRSMLYSYSLIASRCNYSY